MKGDHATLLELSVSGSFPIGERLVRLLVNLGIFGGVGVGFDYRSQVGQ